MVDQSVDDIPMDKLLEPLRSSFCPSDRGIEQELDIEEAQMDIVTSRILAWLIANSGNGEHINIALRAISAASIGLPKEPLRSLRTEDKVLGQLQRCVLGTWDEGRLTVKPTSSPEVVASLFRALSLLAVPDDGYTPRFDTHALRIQDRLRWHIPASRIPVIYVSLSDYYRDTSQDHDTFALNASALMLATYWILKQSDDAKEDATTITLHAAATELLRIIHKHNDGRIGLRSTTLLALAGGCANYIIHMTLRRHGGETIPQLIYALLRLFVTSGKSSQMLRYTIAASLASVTHIFVHSYYLQISADRLFEGCLIQSEGSAPALHLFWNCVHQGAKQQPQSAQFVDTLTRFGILGVLRFLPPTLNSIQDIRRCLDQLEFKATAGFIHIKDLPAHLMWPELEVHAALACLGGVGVETSEQSEGDLVGIIQHFAAPINVSMLQNDSRFVSKSIYGICHARSENLWCKSLRLLGLEIKGRKLFDEADLSNLASLGLLGHLFTVATASRPLASPQAMRRLWGLAALILDSARSTRPCLRTRALNSLLQRNEFAEIQHTFISPLPRNIDELQLERIWYQTLKPMVLSGPIIEIDGGIIDIIIDYYAPSPIGSTPNSWDALPFNPWSEIFNKWSDLSAMFKSRRARERWMNIRRKLRVIRSFANYGPAGQSCISLLSTEDIG
ncbi:hypothetical protein FRC12_012636 [Ceratobasidium sp. 428]|nr:hypothetical protein FRC12_012636 [Ceratobasidium sp. 428]